VFGFSLGKILVLVLIIVAVWRGFKLLERFRERGERPAPKKAARKGARESSKASGPSAVDLVRCPTCGAYTSPGQVCDRGRACPMARG
jgi:ribosomal protein L32